MDHIAEEIYKCKNCGAELGSALNGNVSCNYCGSTFTIPQQQIHITDSNSDDVDQQGDSYYKSGYHEELFRLKQQAEAMLNEMPSNNIDESQTNYRLPYYPSRFDVFKKHVLRGFGYWLAWYIIRIILPFMFGMHYDLASNYFNNIVLSNLWGFYWLMRGCLLIIVLPTIMSSFYYNKFIKR